MTNFVDNFRKENNNEDNKDFTYRLVLASAVHFIILYRIGTSSCRTWCPAASAHKRERSPLSWRSLRSSETGKAIEARMDGYSVMKMEDAAPLGDIFVTATGCAWTITVDHMLKMKDGAILANAGHFNAF